MQAKTLHPARSPAPPGHSAFSGLPTAQTSCQRYAAKAFNTSDISFPEEASTDAREGAESR